MKFISRGGLFLKIEDWFKVLLDQGMRGVEWSFLWPYKIQLVAKLKQNDHQLRRSFGEWTQDKMATDLDFHQKVLLW